MSGFPKRTMKRPTGYTGTQKDDYTGTPAKTSKTIKPKPKARPKASKKNWDSRKRALQGIRSKGK